MRHPLQHRIRFLRRALQCVITHTHTHTQACFAYDMLSVKEKRKKETHVRLRCKVINDTRKYRKYLCEKPAGPFSLLKLQIQTIQLLAI